LRCDPTGPERACPRRPRLRRYFQIAVPYDSFGSRGFQYWVA
jgi:hypothetical protein